MDLWRKFALNLYKCSFWDGRMDGWMDRYYMGCWVGWLTGGMMNRVHAVHLDTDSIASTAIQK